MPYCALPIGTHTVVRGVTRSTAALYREPMATSIDAVREDVLDGLVSGEVARAVPTFSVDRQSDGALMADFGDQGFVYLVTSSRCLATDLRIEAALPSVHDLPRCAALRATRRRPVGSPIRRSGLASPPWTPWTRWMLLVRRDRASGAGKRGWSQS